MKTRKRWLGKRMWSLAEGTQLVTLRDQKKSLSEIAVALGRTIRSVSEKIRALKLPHLSRNRWEGWEESVTLSAKTLSTADKAALLGRTKRAIRCKKHQLQKQRQRQP